MCVEAAGWILSVTTTCARNSEPQSKVRGIRERQSIIIARTTADIHVALDSGARLAETKEDGRQMEQDSDTTSNPSGGAQLAKTTSGHLSAKLDAEPPNPSKLLTQTTWWIGEEANAD